MSQPYQALEVPPPARERGGTEILRAAIVDGGLHVALQRAFDDPDAWGIVLADIAQHVSEAYAAETEISTEEAMARIRDLFNAELDSPTDSDSTSAG